MKTVINGLIYTLVGVVGMAYIAILFGVFLGVASRAFHWVA